MSTPVVMPQMGESIAEGTIVRWIKKVGDSVDRDEPLFEISTDKVDAEIPSPAAGVLTAIAVKEGETVAVNSVVATIGAVGEKVEPAPAAATAKPASDPDKHYAQADGTPGATVAAPAPPSTTNAAPVATAPEARQAPEAPAPYVQHAPEAQYVPEGAEGADRHKSSPLVRKIAKEHSVDIGRIQGSGIGGRVTKQDILGFIDGGAAVTARPASEPAPAPLVRGAADQVVPMSVMRKKIAEHMVFSKRTSAHVYSVFEVNYSRVDQIRQANKDDYERAGAKLTFT
ncbi:MAG: biotin/lipoyl-containing protein, partial [Vicinamibacterales bacterium]